MSSTFARVRLRFDQPPPLLFGSGPGAWLLVDMDSCRLVADLEFLIKRRFGMSRRRRLHLWLDGFLLPPTEKIAVVRDGDIISVEQTEESTSDHSVPPTSGNQVTTSERRQKKRKVQTSEEDEDEPGPAKLRIQNKDRKRKKQKFNGSDSGVSTSSSAVPVPAKVADKKTKDIQKAQTKKKEIQSKNPGKPSKVAPIAPKASRTGNKKHISKPAVSKGSAINGGKQNSTKIVKPVATKSRGKAKDSSSSSSSEDTSSSSEDTDSDSSSSDSSSTSSDTSKEVKPRSSVNVNTKTCNRPGLVSKPQQRKNKPDNSSDTGTSSSDCSSSDTDGNVSVNKQTQSRQAAVGIPEQRHSNPISNGKMSSCNAGKVSSIGGTMSQAHISVPAASPMIQARDTRHVSVLSLNVPITHGLQAVTGTGKQQPASSSHLHKGKATGSPSKGHIVFDSDSESDSSGTGSKGEDTSIQPHAPDRVMASHIDVPQTSTTQAPDQTINGRRQSSRLEDALPPAPPPVPKDYTAFPPLHGPPRVGDRIAYKILEMSANYCPEISSYKEAVVTGYDPSSGDLQLDMVYDITAYMRQNQPGRFEMDVDLEEQEDKTDNKVTVAVSALVEPRLVQG
ncbi:PREDICTED: coilin-like [Branchiostoma belcheri]|uniref:Coilin-like n=1 Tax=Branchiostoma belcheri TaxID=7741 RepID=A0A6P5A613_BRABE|nr:PREDICTED: coilin-like [Branchiostoma belcheri]